MAGYARPAHSQAPVTGGRRIESDRCPRVLSPSRMPQPIASPMRACRSASCRTAAHFAPDADGLAACDIVIDERPHRRHRPAGGGRTDGCSCRSRPRHRAAAPRRRAHPSSTRAISGTARTIPTARILGARSAVMADREARLVAPRTCARAWTSRCAAPSRTAPARIRTHIDSHRASKPRSPGRSLPRCARPGRAASRCRRSRSFRSMWRSTTRRNSARIVETVARHGGVLGGLTFLGEAPGPKLDAALDQVFEAAIAHGLDLDFHVDESMCAGSAHARADRRGGAAPPLQGSDRCRALLLARARADDGARRDHRRASREARHRDRVAADVQHVSAGSHAPAARRAGAASRRCTSSTPPASP